MSTPVLIPTRRRPHLIERQVEAIRAQEGGFEPVYLVNWHKYMAEEQAQSRTAHGILEKLCVPKADYTCASPYEGAETKTYNYPFLARLWDNLFELAHINIWDSVDKGPPYVLMGSDVLPGEPDTLATMIGALPKEEGVVTVPVPVNEDGLLNFWWSGGARARAADVAVLRERQVLGKGVAGVGRLAGGILALNYDPSPLKVGPGSEFYYLKNPRVLVTHSGINIRPDGSEWRV